MSGKCPTFMIMICIGYLCGIIHKAIHAFAGVVVLYGVNLIMVKIDLGLYYHYSRAQEPNV